MSDTECLECGCFIINGRVEYFCYFHGSNQPIINDALDRFLTRRKEGFNDTEDRS